MRILLALTIVSVVTASPLVTLVKSVVCPDGQSECPDGNTCCKLSTGEWGCCPLPNAVCCSDGEHCCPSGYTCDVSAGTCTKQDETLPFFTKIVAKTSVVCPDGQSQCPDGNTCCKLSTGEWGCCPLPNAVCCSDGEHCCPSGYTCDVSAGTCTMQDKTIPFSAKILAKPKNVVCPGEKYYCPDGNTCCILYTGEWGCCPFVKAHCCNNGLQCCPQDYPVCCWDDIHCCPDGTTCNVQAGTCTRFYHTVPFHTKVATKPKNVVCPDSSQCPDGDTCCQLADGTYGCCPLPNAVCCSDKEHCCPSGYKCDVQAGTCTQQDVVIPFFVKRPSLRDDRWL